MAGIDFAKAEVPVSKGYLTPGIYDLKVVNTEYVNDAGKTPSIELTLSTDDGKQMKHKFWLSEKAAGRLRYLHNQMFGKDLTKPFESMDAVAAYFTKALNTAQPTKRFKVSGREGSDGKVYADLPFSDFVTTNDTPVGPYQEGSSQYTQSVARNDYAGKIKDNDSAMIGNKATPASDDDDMPF